MRNRRMVDVIAAATQNIVKGKTLSCLYPKHGTRNILCRHTGKIEGVDAGPNGIYCVLRKEDGTVRSLSLSRMINAKVIG
jgi:hypothetical protein